MLAQSELLLHLLRGEAYLGKEDLCGPMDIWHCALELPSMVAVCMKGNRSGREATASYDCIHSKNLRQAIQTEALDRLLEGQ